MKKWISEKLDFLRVLRRWIMVVLLRDFIAPVLFTYEYEKIGALELNFTDGTSVESIKFMEVPEYGLRKAVSPWKYWYILTGGYYLFMLYEAGYMTYNELKNFLIEPFGEDEISREEIRAWLDDKV